MRGGRERVKWPQIADVLLIHLKDLATLSLSLSSHSCEVHISFADTAIQFHKMLKEVSAVHSAVKFRGQSAAVVEMSLL